MKEKAQEGWMTSGLHTLFLMNLGLDKKVKLTLKLILKLKISGSM